MAAPINRIYVRNCDLLVEIARSKANGAVNRRLAEMLILMVTRHFQKSNFRGYSYNDELQAAALAALCGGALKFNAERSQNPFSYYTTIMVNAANRVLMLEKKQRQIRDELYLEAGLLPSFAAQAENDLGYSGA